VVYTDIQASRRHRGKRRCLERPECLIVLQSDCGFLACDTLVVTGSPSTFLTKRSQKGQQFQWCYRPHELNPRNGVARIHSGHRSSSGPRTRRAKVRRMAFWGRRFGSKPRPIARSRRGGST
jgi:hypothetical protein